MGGGVGGVGGGGGGGGGGPGPCGLSYTSIQQQAGTGCGIQHQMQVNNDELRIVHNRHKLQTGQSTYTV